MTTVRSFTSPVGRLVGGDVWRENDKDFEGRPLTTRDGKPRVEYVVIVAFLKTDPATTAMIQEIQAAAHEGFPTLFANGAQPQSFSYKIVDGDSAVPNQKGNAPNTKEGYPGNYVITFKTSYAPDAYDSNNVQIVDPKQIKRGYYVRVYATVKGNESQANPGVFVNHSMVQLCGFGEEITSGPDAATAFGEQAPALPAGASATPLAPTGALPGSALGAPTTPPPAGGNGVPAPAPVAPAPAPAPVAPAPAPGFGAPGSTAPAPIPPAPPPAAPPPPAAGPQTTPGCPYTYDQLKAQGWSDDQMRAAGHLA